MEPRYAGGANAGTDHWLANPHLPEGNQEPYVWDVKVHLQTGIGLKEVSSPSHKIAVSYAGPSTADIKLDQSGGGTKDFVLHYRLAGDKIETGLLQFEEPSAGLGRPAEKFFALLVEPPKRPTLADIPGREYIFLLDVSGSIHGFPIETSKELMRNLLSKLRPTDHFNIARSGHRRSQHRRPRQVVFQGGGFEPRPCSCRCTRNGLRCCR